MRNMKFAVATLVIGLWGLASAATAQDSTRPVRPFGGFFADMLGLDDQPNPRSNSSQQHLKHPQKSPYGAQDGNTGDTSNASRWDAAPAGSTRETMPPRAGGVQSVPFRPASTDVFDEPPPGLRSSSTVSPAPVQRPVTRDQRPVTDSNYSFQWDQDNTTKSAPTSEQRVAATSRKDDAAANSSSHLLKAPETPALHERLKGLRESVFDSPQAGPATPSVASSTRQPEPTVGPAQNDVPADPTESGPRLAPPRANRGAAADRLTVAAQTESSSPVEKAERAERVEKGSKTADNGSDTAVLVNRKSPILSVETFGPRRIAVGKEAAYEVTIQNSGDVAAEDVVVFVGLPDWASMSGTTPSTGEVRPLAQNHGEPCQWHVGRVDAKAREKLTLKIVPRQSRPFELAVRWETKAAVSETTIEVQEPKLALKLDGPREVLFGKRELFKLKLSNAGSGPADNVLLTLMPLNTVDTQPVMHRLGSLAAGEERVIEIELNARQAGNLTIQVEARGDGNAHAELAERVQVRRAGLQMDMEGPAVQYVGMPGGYKIRLRNPGDAVAKNVKLAVSLPTGVRFTSGTDGVVASNGGSRVQWSLDQIEPGAERIFVLKCALALSGPTRLQAGCTADDDLTASAETTTQVQAIADLRLEIKDPEGPVPVGNEAVYELRIRNRGTRTAENIQVLAYFSNGIEPTGAEGHTFQVSPGQVVFAPIPSLAPAAELTLRVRAKANNVGNHVFRAEVHCKPLGTRLVREETTHFYQDGPAEDRYQQRATEQAARPGLKVSSAPPIREEIRTADRRPPMPMPQATAVPMASEKR